MATTLGKPLSLTTRPKGERPYIEIEVFDWNEDGTPINSTQRVEKYDLAVKGDLGIADQVKMQRLIARWEQISDGNAADLTDEQADAVEQSFQWAPGVILRGCPAEVLERLDDDQRIEILMAFSEATEVRKTASVKTTKPRAKRKKS